MFEFVDHARLWWRRWSTWLAGIFATAAGLCTLYPGLLVGLLGQIPEDWRGFLAGAVFVIVFVVPVLTVNLRQPKLKEQADAVRK